MQIFLILIVFIILSCALVWYLISNDKGSKEPIAALWKAVGFGFLGVFIASLLEWLLVPKNNLMPGTPLFTLFGASMTVGTIEETCKFLPLAFFIYHKNYFNEHTDGIIYFAIAGLSFGLPENIMYTIQFGTATGIGRLLLTPIFHAATTALVGFYLAKAKINHRGLSKVALALCGAIILHGFYDFGLSAGNNVLILLSIFITLSVSIGLFILYIVATDLDQEKGLSIVGNNSFCRSCGYPNQKHLLYCTHCGNYA